MRQDERGHGNQALRQASSDARRVEVGTAATWETRSRPGSAAEGVRLAAEAARPILPSAAPPLSLTYSHIAFVLSANANPDALPALPLLILHDACLLGVCSAFHYTHFFRTPFLTLFHLGKRSDHHRCGHRHYRQHSWDIHNAGIRACD